MVDYREVTALSYTGQCFGVGLNEHRRVEGNVSDTGDDAPGGRQRSPGPRATEYGNGETIDTTLYLSHAETDTVGITVAPQRVR